MTVINSKWSTSTFPIEGRYNGEIAFYQDNFIVWDVTFGAWSEINQEVLDPTEGFRFNQDETGKLRKLLEDYDRLKQIVKEHYPEDLL